MAKRINKPQQQQQAEVTKPVEQAKPQAVVKFAPAVVFRDGAGHTFIQVGKRKLDDVAVYLTSRAGYVTLEYGDTIGEKLKPVKYPKPYSEAVKPYTQAGGNTLDVSNAALKVLEAIAANTDPSRIDFIGTMSNSELAVTAKPRANTSTGTKKTAALADHVQLKSFLDEFKLDGKKVRQWLRAHYAKPTAGWQWPKNEAENMREAIKAQFIGAAK